MSEDPRPPILAVHVSVAIGEDTFFRVGEWKITAIEWGERPGHMAMIPTVRVFREGRLYSEHPFHNLLSVFYQESIDNG